MDWRTVKRALWKYKSANVLKKKTKFFNTLLGIVLHNNNNKNTWSKGYDFKKKKRFFFKFLLTCYFFPFHTFGFICFLFYKFTSIIKKKTEMKSKKKNLKRILSWHKFINRCIWVGNSFLLVCLIGWNKTCFCKINCYQLSESLEYLIFSLSNLIFFFFLYIFHSFLTCYWFMFSYETWSMETCNTFIHFFEMDIRWTLDVYDIHDSFHFSYLSYNICTYMKMDTTTTTTINEKYFVFLYKNCRVILRYFFKLK